MSSSSSFNYLCSMWNRNEIIFFRKTLIDWYSQNKRDFPWRRDNISHYELIFSEILLQRTKAETVSHYYSTFFKKFPNWETISNARLSELENILKPLGLYKHRAQRILKIVADYKSRQGTLPKNVNELQDSSFATLYISNAFELFILNRRAALLDVNMSRVLSRFFYPKEFKDVRSDKIIQELANDVINVKKCKEINWAILDFASSICKKQSPICNKCSLKVKCRYYKQTQELVTGNSEDSQLSFQYDSEKAVKPNKPYSVVSLFSGCGGMDLGFEGGFLVHKDSVNEKIFSKIKQEKFNDNFVRLQETKFQTVFANDILIEARNAWVKYFSKKEYSPDIYHVDSIVDLVKLHRRGVNVFPEQVDVVTGGFPCQDFSLAGKRNGFNSHKDHKGILIKQNIPSIETRGQLYMWLKEVIEITKPKIFIAENVKGLVNLSNVKEIIQRDFSNANGKGYLVLEPIVLHAANYGVPQSRERVIFIGINKSSLNSLALRELSKKVIIPKYNPYPQPTHAFNIKGELLKKPVTLSSIFQGLPEPDLSDDPSQIFYSKAKFMGKHCQGQTEISLNKIGPTIRAEHHGNIEYRRLAIENGGKLIDEIVKEKLSERRLTPRECALIQTFPPDYEFVVPTNSSRFFISPSAAYKLIGNAVPPLLAFHIAKRLEELWDLYFNPLYDGSSHESKSKRQPVSGTVG